MHRTQPSLCTLFFSGIPSCWGNGICSSGPGSQSRRERVSGADVHLCHAPTSFSLSCIFSDRKAECGLSLLKSLQGCRILAWIDIRGDCGIDVSVASSGLVWPSARLIQWPVITGSYRSQVSPGRERGSLDLRAFPLIKTQTGIRPRNRWIPSSFLRLSKGRTTFPHWRD